MKSKNDKKMISAKKVGYSNNCNKHYSGLELRSWSAVGPLLLVLVRAQRGLRVLLIRHGHRRICQAAQVQAGISGTVLFKRRKNILNN